MKLAIGCISGLSALLLGANGQDLRIFGTNLVDLSSPSAGEHYTIEGTVTSWRTGELHFKYSTTSLVMVPSFSFGGGSEDLLRFLVEQKMAGPISAGHALSLSPQLAGDVESVREEHSGILFGYPWKIPSGKRIRTLALPSGDGEWLYGRPVAASETFGFTSIFRVTSSGIIEQRYDAAALLAASDPDLRRLVLATNGAPREQFEVGMHYWMGLGVETNAPLALYWIQKSADQNFHEARDFLKSSPKPPSSTAATR